MIKFPKHKASLSLTHNDHLDGYSTVAQEVELQNGYYSKVHWISSEERAKAIETNEVWTLHWYPDTPIGSYHYHASTLESLMEYVNANHE